MTKRTNDWERPAKNDRRKEHRLARHAVRIAVKGHTPRVSVGALSWSHVHPDFVAVFAAMPDEGIEPEQYVEALAQADVLDYEYERELDEREYDDAWYDREFEDPDDDEFIAWMREHYVTTA